MEVLLINTPMSFPISARGSAIPLGLAYLVAYLRNNGIDTYVIDLYARPSSTGNVLKIIGQINPKLIGIGLITHNCREAFKLANDIKNNFSVHITMGGHHASWAVIDTFKNSLVDSIVIGEGEETLLELSRAVLKKNDLSGIPGLAYRKGDSIIFNESRPLINNLDAIPYPARESFHNDYSLNFPASMNIKFNRVDHMITSRGCPYSCRFCSTVSMHHGRVRFRNAALVVDEMQYLVNERVCDGIYIYDDFFTCSDSHLSAIHDEMKRRNFQVPIFCYSRVDAVNDAKMEKLAEMGVKCISFGFESGSQRILDYLNKHIKVEQTIKAVRLCKRYGILAKGTFVAGLHCEGIADYYKTFRLISKLRSIQPEISIGYGVIGVSIYPGTQMYKDAVDIGFLPKDFSWVSDCDGIPMYKNAPILYNRRLAKLTPLLKIYDKIMLELGR